ncbi:flagellar basal body-associated FliL family protein [Sulfitobacter albidus]
MKKLLPVLLLLVGLGGGVGAGIFLRPDTSMASVPKGNGEAESIEKEVDANTEDKQGQNEDAAVEGDTDSEFVKLNNQFVVPIVADERVAALVVLSLSVEVPAGETDIVYRREPKLRDSFLQILFDHANVGGFDGAFTQAEVLDPLRSALREVARRDIGSEIVHDVLITEIARQDY